MLLPHSLSPLEPQDCLAGPELLNHFSPLVPLRLLPRYFFHLLVFFGPFGPGGRWRLPPCPSTSGPPAEEQKSNFGSRAHSCHGYHGLYLWRKNCHVEKGSGSFHIHRKTMKELGALAVLGVREQPNLAQNLVTHRH